MWENKRITNIAKLIITLLVWCLFVNVWINNYNGVAFRSHQTEGFILTTIIWLAFYMWLCDLFKAFSIASSTITDIIISQLICIGLVDLLSYVAVCFIIRGWAILIPGLICFLLQLILTSVTVVATKDILSKKITPTKTVVLYGNDFDEKECNFFCDRLLRKYRHMFEISEIVDSNADDIYKFVDENQQLIMVGVPYEQRKSLAKYCIDAGKTFYYIPEVEELLFENCKVKNLLDTPLKRFYFIDNNSTYFITKRLLDLFFAALLLIIAIPFVVIAAIAIKIEDGGPVFFKQLRVTKDGKEFKIIKLRSMLVDSDSYGVRPTVEKDSRVTKVGAFIRKTRIDELPQLINIIKGDMSFVGPRPERIEHVEKYEKQLPSFKYRHMVRGGLTGYAQVYGKYNTSPEDKLKLDLIYIINQSLFLDFRLILLTVRTLFQRESTEGFSKETASKF